MLAFNYLGKLGRLGNQMFQYASLRGIASRRGYDFGIPQSNFNDEWKSHQLFEVFDLPNLSKKNIRYLDMGHAPIVKETQFHFDQLLFDQCPNDVSLWGFFQSEKYFKHIDNSIREDFIFRSHILDPCIEMMSDMKDCVSLHVRRTDYLQNSGNHHNLAMSYYKKALEHFEDRQVLVFSDDPEWCKNQKIFSGERFLISESGDNTIDLCLMTLCTDHIIANSSFSWWGAWLSKGHKVIAPKKWFGPNNIHNDIKDLYCDSWEII
jgi:hypothetical protein